jgi:hypothetical protein
VSRSEAMQALALSVPHPIATVVNARADAFEGVADKLVS